MAWYNWVKKPVTPKRLFVGEEFIVAVGAVKPRHCRFIKVTPKGYNFLNVKTNTCILPSHLYLSKCENHKEGNWFFVRDNISLSKIDNGKDIQSTGKDTR